MSETQENCDERELLVARHRKEKKALQAEIQSIKKSVPKGDKKQAKQSKIKIAELEQDLELRHEKEIESFEQQNSNTSSSKVAENLDNLVITEAVESDKKTPKVSKAQRKREKKAAKAKDHAEMCAEAELDYKNSARYKEEEEIKNILNSMSYKIKPIRSDGDCLYSAVTDQLDSNLSVLELRHKVADYMMDNKDDFMPFLTNDDGNQFSHEEFSKYCDDIKTPGIWGGQLELRALSHILKTPIHVIQSTGPVIILGEEFKEKSIILTYHRHELGLGEHYNSVKLFDQNQDLS
uniref:OTU domain-containing protein 6B-like n=1 Tax=Phallusia mammillata TaxID=59560 RepID=A0A6F9DNP3_9ASCI|nr:OTU domain-containing protein 6B-like [Phallusia mammillata]